MAQHTLARSELNKQLLRFADTDLKYAREDAMNHHTVAQTKVGRVEITYDPQARTYTLRAQRMGSTIELETLCEGVPARFAKAKMVEVYDVRLVDTVVVD